jgi:hypothetical protein
MNSQLRSMTANFAVGAGRGVVIRELERPTPSARDDPDDNRHHERSRAEEDTCHAPLEAAQPENWSLSTNGRDVGFGHKRLSRVKAQHVGFALVSRRNEAACR